MGQVRGQGDPHDDKTETQTARTVTRLLGNIRTGDANAESELMQLVQGELRVLARRAAARLPDHLALQPTAILNEAYLRLAGRNGVVAHDRQEFFAHMARAMRDVLVENARRRLAEKRGGRKRHVPIDERDGPVTVETPERFLDLVEAIDRLRDHDAAAAEVVMLKFFGGLTFAQVATATGRPLIRCRREWGYARAFLHREIVERLPEDPPQSSEK